MSDDPRSAEHARLAAVLEALRVAPTDELRAERAQARQRALHRGDAASRMLLAEHHRAIGTPDQAARFGIVEPGWVRATELRALRLVLLRSVASGTVRGTLGLGRRASVPPEVADLVVNPERAMPQRGDVMRLLATIALLGGILWWCVAVGRAVLAMTQGERVLDALRAVRVEALVAGVASLVGFVWLRRHPRPRIEWARRLELEALRRVEAVLPSLVLHAERHALLRGWLACSWTSEAQEPVRRMLVDLARERRRPVEAGRWGVAVDGLTTSDERARFATTLRAGDEWMLELERRTERAPGRLGVDERDALRRAGVPVHVLEAFDAPD